MLPPGQGISGALPGVLGLMAKKKTSVAVQPQPPLRKFAVQLPACVELTVEAVDEADALARYLEALGATSTRCQAEIHAL